MTDDREDRASDAPADLGREREAFVRQFLRRGFEITESVIAENHELREALDRARDENARLRAQLASNDAIRELIRTIEQLEADRRALTQRSDELEATSKETAARSVEVEAELHDLANLYIAATHLHSTLSLRGVLKNLGELLQQLVGAERFAIFVLDASGRTAWPVIAEQMAVPASIQVGEGTPGLVMAMGVAKIEDSAHPAGSFESPVAAVPMMVRDTCVGVIVIASVFAQKERWAGVDREFLELLGAQGGTALIAACLFADRAAEQPSRAGDPLDALRTLQEQLSRLRDTP